MSENYPNYFGEFLANLRRKNRLRQKQIAFDARIDPSYLAALEGGRRLPPREKVLTKLAKALNASPQEELELNRSAKLSVASKEICDQVGYFQGARLAVLILELSDVMTATEIAAFTTIIEGFRLRKYLAGKTDM